ncbi:MAG: hypothetical protein Aureis2KO_13650 [Aureisphaera sp.]
MKEKLRVIQLIHLALCAGAILAYIMLGGMDALTNFKLPTIDSPSILYVLVPFAAYILSNFLFRHQLKKLDRSLDIEENFTAYQTASIVRWAILEGTAFYLLTAQKDLIIFGIPILLYLILIRPTLDKMKMDLS